MNCKHSLICKHFCKEKEVEETVDETIDEIITEYRMLRNGEQIEYGDQYLNTDNVWMSINFFPIPFNITLLTIRRPCRYRMLHEGEIIRADDEWVFSNFETVWKPNPQLIGGKFHRRIGKVRRRLI